MSDLPPPGDPYQNPPDESPTSGGYPTYSPGQHSAYPPTSGAQPTSGQPSYGQPPYGQPPISGQPSYGQPPYGQQPGYGTYGQPTSGQPYGQPYGEPASGAPYEGYGQPAYTGYPPVQPPKKRTGLWIGLGAVLLVLCLGGGAFAGAMIFNASKDTPSSTSASDGPSTAASSGTDTGPSASPDSTSAPGDGTAAVKVVAPAKLLGQPKLDEPELNKLAESTSTQMSSAAPNVRQSVSAFYGNINQKKLTMLIAVAGDIEQPAAFATGMTIGLKSSLKAGTFVAVPAGPLGGTAKCADARASDIDLAVCIWSDRGSFGIVGFYYKKVSQVKADFLKARSAVEVPA